jgi:hypothetical protein
MRKNERRECERELLTFCNYIICFADKSTSEFRLHPLPLCASPLPGNQMETSIQEEHLMARGEREKILANDIDIHNVMERVTEMKEMRIKCEAREGWRE